METKTYFNEYILEDREISIRTLLLKILLHWKLILLAACIFAVLGYGFAQYKKAAQIKNAEAEVSVGEAETISEETAEEETERMDFDGAKWNISTTIHRYENALNNENAYMQESMLMHMDPYHMISTTRDYQLRARGNVDINELSAVGRKLTGYATGAEMMTLLAEKYDTEPQYMKELVSSGVRENMYEVGVSVQDDADMASAETSFESNEEEVLNYYFYITVKANDKEFTNAVADQIMEYIVEKSSEITQIRFTLTPMESFTYEAVDGGVISSQNDSRLRAFDYGDRLVKSSTMLDNLEKARETVSEEEKEQGKSGHVSGKKYAAAGFLGGAVLMILLLILRMIFSSGFGSEDEFRSWFMIHPLGTAPSVGSKKYRGLTKLIARKLDGTFASKTQEEFYKMTETNVVNAVQNNRHVLVTGTVEKADMALLKEQLFPGLTERCAQTEFLFKENIIGDPETRACLKETDGIILVEKKNWSKVDQITKETEIALALDKKILGAILL